MKAKANTFLSRKSAIAHLVALGWKFSHKSLGDMVFRHTAKSYANLVVQLRAGRWEVQAYGFAANVR